VAKFATQVSIQLNKMTDKLFLSH